MMQKPKRVGKKAGSVAIGGMKKASGTESGKKKMNKPIGGLSEGQMQGGDESDESKKVPPKAKKKPGATQAY